MLRRVHGQRLRPHRLSLVRKAAQAHALTLLLGAALLAGCSGSGSPPNDPGASFGVPVELANCRDWNAATVAERLAVVRQIRAFAGGPTGTLPGQNGATIPDDKAYDLFKGWCDQSFTKDFKLYKLYTRAASFQNLVG
jgi:hypothetical protein